MSQSWNNEKPEFWLVNISDRNVCLSDLALTIPARKAMNLLDKDHFSYTYEELKESMKSGSIFSKRHIIKVGDRPPVYPDANKKELSKRPIQIRVRSIVDVNMTEPEYDEMAWSDEKYADEMSTDFEWGE